MAMPEHGGRKVSGSHQRKALKPEIGCVPKLYHHNPGAALFLPQDIHVVSVIHILRKTN